jgi:hypothetical protein
MSEKIKTPMQVFEDKIEDLIAKSDNDELMEAWLEFLEEKNKRAQLFLDILKDLTAEAKEKIEP